MLDNFENNSSDLVLSKITIEPIDLIRRMYVYDGSPEDWDALITISMGMSHWNFSLAELNRQDFSQLEVILGTKNFQTIIATQGYVYPRHQFSGFRGEGNLPLYYYTRDDMRDRQNSATHELILVSFGEFQPSRWIAHLEGLWKITGINF